MTQLQNQRKVTLSHVCVCVNAIRTILQFTLVTHGHLFRVRLGATKGTNIPIITVTPAFSGVPKQRGTKSEVKTYARGHHDAPRNKPKIVPVSSIAPQGWSPKEGGNAMSPLHSRGSPTKGTKSEVKVYATGHHDAPRIKAWIQRLSRFPQ